MIVKGRLRAPADTANTRHRRPLPEAIDEVVAAEAIEPNALADVLAKRSWDLSCPEPAGGRYRHAVARGRLPPLGATGGASWQIQCSN
jgi:hypothetical protein